MNETKTNLASQAEQIAMIGVDALRPGLNNRPNGSGLSPESLRELAASIEAQGILQPLLVRRIGNNGHFEIIAGERRWRAAKVAKRANVPCIVRDVGDAQAAELRAIENVQREGLTPIEEAKGYQELLHMKGPDGKPAHTIETLAVKVGKSTAVIYGRLKLLRLPEIAVRAMVEGKLTASTAELIARIPDAALRRKATLEILSDLYVGDKEAEWAEKEKDALDPEFEPMSFREAKEHIRDNYMVRLKGAPFDVKDAELLPVELEDGERIAGGACADCPLRTGNRIDAETLGMETSADVCTNPGCFARKKENKFKLDAAKAKANGQKLLPEKQAQKLFSCGELSHYGAGRKFVDLRAPFPGDKKKKWDEVLQGELPGQIVQARDDNQKLHYLLPVEAAAEALKAAGRKVPDGLVPKTTNHTTQADYAQKEAERKTAVTRGKELAHLLAEKVFEKAKAEPTEKWWQYMVKEVDPWWLKEWKNAPKKLKTAADCRAYLTLVVKCGDGDVVDWNGEVEEELLDLCAFYGVDAKAIIAQKQAEWKAGEKAGAADKKSDKAKK